MISAEVRSEFRPCFVRPVGVADCTDVKSAGAGDGDGDGVSAGESEGAEGPEFAGKRDSAGEGAGGGDTGGDGERCDGSIPTVRR